MSDVKFTYVLSERKTLNKGKKQSVMPESSLSVERLQRIKEFAEKKKMFSQYRKHLWSSLRESMALHLNKFPPCPGFPALGNTNYTVRSLYLCQTGLI